MDRDMAESTPETPLEPATNNTPQTPEPINLETSGAFDDPRLVGKRVFVKTSTYLYGELETHPGQGEQYQLLCGDAVEIIPCKNPGYVYFKIIQYGPMRRHILEKFTFRCPRNRFHLSGFLDRRQTDENAFATALVQKRARKRAAEIIQNPQSTRKTDSLNLHAKTQPETDPQIVKRLVELGSAAQKVLDQNPE